MPINSVSPFFSIHSALVHRICTCLRPQPQTAGAPRCPFMHFHQVKLCCVCCSRQAGCPADISGSSRCEVELLATAQCTNPQLLSETHAWEKMGKEISVRASPRLSPTLWMCETCHFRASKATLHSSCGLTMGSHCFWKLLFRHRTKSNRKENGSVKQPSFSVLEEEAAREHSHHRSWGDDNLWAIIGMWPSGVH